MITVSSKSTGLQGEAHKEFLRFISKTVSKTQSEKPHNLKKHTKKRLFAHIHKKREWRQFAAQSRDPAQIPRQHSPNLLQIGQKATRRSALPKENHHGSDDLQPERAGLLLHG